MGRGWAESSLGYRPRGPWKQSLQAVLLGWCCTVWWGWGVGGTDLKPNMNTPRWRWAMPPPWTRGLAAPGGRANSGQVVFSSQVSVSSSGKWVPSLWPTENAWCSAWLWCLINIGPPSPGDGRTEPFLESRVSDFWKADHAQAALAGSCHSDTGLCLHCHLLVRLGIAHLAFDGFQPGPWTFPCGSAGKKSTCNAGDLGSTPGL